MDTRYVPAAHEQRLFERWLSAGVFAGGNDAGRPTYTIPVPPPNVTGELHMGHALNGSMQDTLIRLKRMQGYDTLWICGTDHASIAVHAVIERQLRSEGLTRWALGRERFLERVWEWRAKTGATIIQQYKRLGASLDYDHERFTMDDRYLEAVLTMFVELYRKGYIYRDNRLINWCPTCASTISDLEVRYEHAADTLFEVRYPIAGTNDFVHVATVRPETMIADTAVAVHPDDPRYANLVGRTVVVPLVDREVPVIADEYVRSDFGTGALKVTPGHDPNDFEIGRRHNLEELTAIGLDGRMTELAGEFAGMPVGEARDHIRDALHLRGLIADEDPYEHEVGHCDRTGDRIEPLISLQWFMRMDELARPANEAVRSGRVRFHPRTQENTYFSWMDNLRPWCISRQLWWGHQIPVWYCPDGHETVELTEPDACMTCGSEQLERDPDVLDTWFSSALWPFATLGWPQRDDPRLDRFYPGDVLVTDRQIINLWVARMLMMGIEFMGEIPFHDVLIHSTIYAPDGRRMSKSLGTGIDPLELVGEFGADATRYGLLKMSSTQDVRFDRGAIDEGGKLANKLWNAARFTLRRASDDERPAPPGPDAPLEDRWIASRYEAALAGVLRQLETFDYSAATKTLYAFIWNDFCDWYVELAKRRPADGGGSGVALWALDGILRMTHPILPFVTEAIWEHMPAERGLLMLEAYPEPDASRRDPAVDAAIAEWIDFLTAVRSDPATSRVPPEWAPAYYLEQLPKRYSPAGAAAPAAIVDSLAAELEDARRELERARRILANQSFLAKAPAAKVAEEREKERRYAARLAAIEARLAELA